MAELNMDTDSIDVLCLQEYPDLIDQCVDLLNSEWPRSKAARLRSILQGSVQSFPTSLVLVDKKSKTEVIGHSKILPVPYNKESCFVESVVISSKLRGKGYGRLIMERTEEFVKVKGIKIIYLTTHDQQCFYRKLGYELCDPVVIYGGGSPAFHKMLEDQRSQCSQENSSCIIPEETTFSPSKTSGKECIEFPPPSQTVEATPPPPPPPPLLPIAIPPNQRSKDVIIVSDINNIVKVTMKKVL